MNEENLDVSGKSASQTAHDFVQFCPISGNRRKIKGVLTEKNKQIDRKVRSGIFRLKQLLLLGFAKLRKKF